MSNRRRCGAIATMIVGVTTLTVADEPIPPLPRVGRQSDGSVQIAELPKQHSPCTLDLDAEWLKPLKTTRTEAVRFKIPQPINCEGAVIKSLVAKGSGSVTSFQFTITFRPGSDREGIVSFGILDDDKRLVALGEATGNLDEDADSYLDGTLKLQNKEFDRVFAKGQKPVLRITLRVEDN